MSLAVTRCHNLWFAIFATTRQQSVENMSPWTVPCTHSIDKPHHEERKMKKQYKFAELTKEEKEYHEMILLEEVDVQAWFAIAFSSIFDEELFVTVQ